MQENLKQPFIGLKLTQYDYDRLKMTLLVPSMLSYSYKRGGKQKTLELIYVIEGYIISAKQYHWIASIKFAIEKKLGCRVAWIDEYYFNSHDIVEYNNLIYTLAYLDRFFSSTIIQYPNILYPCLSKDLYKHLCWAATKLYRQDILYTELLICIGIRFNNKLHISEKFNRRALLRYIYTCLEFIRNEAPGVLKGKKLKDAYSKGGKIRLSQKLIEREKAIAQIKELLESSEKFKKKNGTPHIGKLAVELNLTRQTISKYLKDAHSAHS